MIDKKDPKQVEAIKHFKTGFLLIFIGCITVILNFLALVGAIFLILGIKSLTESKLKNIEAYKNTYKWIKITAVAFVLYILVYIILFVYIFFAIFAAAASGGSNASPPIALFYAPFGAVILFVLVYFVSFLILQYKFTLALKDLAVVSGEDRYSKGAGLFLAGIFLYILSIGIILVAVAWILSSIPQSIAASSLQSGNMQSFGMAIIVILLAFLVTVAMYILQAVAAYYCYKASSNIVDSIEPKAKT